MRSDAPIPWNAYPALQLALCLAAGIWLAATMPVLSYTAWCIGGGIGYALAFGTWRLTRNRLVTPGPLLNTFAVGLVTVTLGGACFVSTEALAPQHIGQLLQGSRSGPLTLQGRVAGEPVARSRGLRCVVEVWRGWTETDTLVVQGQVQVTLARSPRMHGQPFPPIEQGTLIQLHGTVHPVPERRNPADFAYKEYLRHRDVHALMTVYEAADVAVLGRSLGPLERAVVTARRWVRARVARWVPSEDGRTVMAALLLGDRSQLGETVRGRFARTGLMHLLAVSGLHVLLVGLVAYGLMKPLLIRLRLSWRSMECVRAAATMGLLLTYMMLTGASASVVRAVIMAGLYIGGNVLQRSPNALNSLGAAALPLLIARPTYLFDAGFQLSFAAVAALITVNPLLTRCLPPVFHRNKALQWIAATFTTSLAATLGTTPILLFHFGAASFAGLLLNFAAIPLTVLTLASGLSLITFAGLLPPVGAAMGAAADATSHALLYTAEAGDAWLPWAAVRAPAVTGWTLLLLALALTVLVQWPRRRLRWKLCAAMLLCATGGIWHGVAERAGRPALDVVFFDVGQGDAALVSFPNGRHLLIDAGGRDAYVDHGARTLLPHLRRYGIEQLDAIVVTHPHSDHLGGVPTLLRAVAVSRVIHNGETYDSDLYRETALLLDSLGVRRQAAAAGDTLLLDPSVRVQVLGPAPGHEVHDTNNASLVVRIAYGETVLLFTGDAEKEEEAQLVAHYGPLLASAVVKVAHHGSTTSSEPALVARVIPGVAAAPIAVVSVARNNIYRLPSTTVLARWRSAGARVQTTREGAIWLRSDGTRVRHVAWR